MRWPQGRKSTLLVDFSLLQTNAAFRRVMIARLISLLGLGLLAVAVPFQVYDLTGSSPLVGAISALDGLGMFTGLLYGGVWADQYERRRLILLGRSACGLGFAGLALNSALPEPSLSALAILSCWDGFFSGVSVTALTAVMPSLVGRENLLQARALGMLAVRLATVISPLIGGVLIATWGVGWNYTGAALATMLTVLTLLGLPHLPTCTRSKGNPIRLLTEALVMLCQHRIILGLSLLGIVMTTATATRVLFPALAEQGFNGGAAHLGLLMAMVPAGATLGALLSGRARRTQRPGVFVLVASGLSLGALAPLALAESSILPTLLGPSALFIACGALVLQGFASSQAALVQYTLIQNHCPDQALGRINGLWTAQEVAGSSIAAAGIGALGGMLPPAQALALVFSLGLVVLLVSWRPLAAVRAANWQTPPPPEQPPQDTAAESKTRADGLIRNDVFAKTSNTECVCSDHDRTKSALECSTNNRGHL